MNRRGKILVKGDGCRESNIIWLGKQEREHSVGGAELSLPL